MLGVLIWSAIGQSLLPLLSRAFYAWKETLRPVMISLIGTGLALTLAFHLVLNEGQGLAALAMSMSMGANLTAILLLFVLAKRLKVDIGEILDYRRSAEILIALGAMSAFVVAVSQIEMSAFIGLFVKSGVGAIVYLGLMKFLFKAELKV